MKFVFKKIAALWLISVLVFTLSACKNKNDTDASKGASSIPEINAEAGDDTQDPENTEIDAEQGERVKAESLTPQTGKANGIDVSKWQGKIDWSKVKNSGIDFAIIRIGYRGENGTIYKDVNADYNIQQAQKAGVLVGVYFFSTAVSSTEATEEADWTLSAIKGYSISYPVVYDCEGFANSNSRMHSLTNAQRTDNAIAFLSTIEKSGYEGMFYASKTDLEDYWETSRISADYKIWLARYTTPPYPETSHPDYQGRYDMWQYTNMGTVNGIEGNTDMIVSYFTRQLSNPKDTAAAPDTADAPKDTNDLIYTDVNQTVTAKDVVNLRTGAGTNFDIAGSLKNGDTLTRTGVGSNGWSRLNYNGKTVYAITSYLTTDLSYKIPVTPAEDIVEGNTFTAVNDEVTAKDTVNLRSIPSTDGEIVATLKNGEFLQRTAKSNRGWSRLIFNGKTVYAVTSYLTTDATPPPAEDTGDDIGMTFQSVDEQVTAKQETNLRSAPTTTGSEIIYTLKNGEYIRRTGVSASGWSRLNYNGKTVYAISSFLTN